MRRLAPPRARANDAPGFAAFARGSPTRDAARQVDDRKRTYGGRRPPLPRRGASSAVRGRRGPRCAVSMRSTRRRLKPSSPCAPRTDTGARVRRQTRTAAARARGAAPRRPRIVNRLSTPPIRPPRAAPFRLCRRSAMRPRPRFARHGGPRSSPGTTQVPLTACRRSGRRARRLERGCSRSAPREKDRGGPRAARCDATAPHRESVGRRRRSGRVVRRRSVSAADRRCGRVLASLGTAVRGPRRARHRFHSQPAAAQAVARAAWNADARVRRRGKRTAEARARGAAPRRPRIVNRLVDVADPDASCGAVPSPPPIGDAAASSLRSARRSAVLAGHAAEFPTRGAPRHREGVRAALRRPRVTFLSAPSGSPPARACRGRRTPRRGTTGSSSRRRALGRASRAPSRSARAPPRGAAAPRRRIVPA